ncbi:putative lysine-specific demethylase JMJ14 [Acorus calamus]|uniref:Lysine-specific demethylase JMJ14 n=1 Tax=Acorus calamus TaxID=4465 RepID=A0AAV9E3D9_ACOCL|nr:putative lysine-specific demethylase JMJ14 [Acorus calamus]
MGIECMKSPYKEDSDGIPKVPPGFMSLTSFNLKRVHDDVSCTANAFSSDVQQDRADVDCSIGDDVKLTRPLRQRPWVNYSQFDNSSDESDLELFDEDIPPPRCLPKGVTRGCAECSTCQKVTAGWRPEEACRPDLMDSPVFFPTEEEFKDTLKYIASIRQKAEPYGICRIVPPSSWKPPCPLMENETWEKAKFSTRIQQINKLQNRCSVKKMSLRHHLMQRKRRRLIKAGMRCGYNGNGDGVMETNELNCSDRFGFEAGPDFTLESFQKYANDFKKQYFRTKDLETESTSCLAEPPKQVEPSVVDIEGEYWRIVEKPTEEIEVLYGADLETGVFGSGFPKVNSMSSDVDEQYVKSGWNLNNFPRLPGSVLSFENAEISGVLIPWLYVGMCFSSFCWHVEDHHLYSLNYMHWGAPKIWYGVPGRAALKLEVAMKKYLPDLFEEQPDLLHKLVTQLSPSILKSEGVPIFRCVQHAGEFVLTFPRAYHAGFNSGFNCAEAVNVAPVDWLPHGQNAVELYREQARKISISHDKLLLGAAREAIRAQWEILFPGKKTFNNILWKGVCGPDGILAIALKARVEMERVRREYLCGSSQSLKMDPCFDETNEQECFVCLYDLYLSAATCRCSPDKFACLLHAKQLCRCAWSERQFLFRYEMEELHMLVDALGGKSSSIYRWGNLYLGLSLSSYVSSDKPKLPEASRRLFTVGTPEKKGEPLNRSISTTGTAGSPALTQENKVSELHLASPGIANRQVSQAGTSNTNEFKSDEKNRQDSASAKCLNNLDTVTPKPMTPGGNSKEIIVIDDESDEKEGISLINVQSIVKKENPSGSVQAKDEDKGIDKPSMPIGSQASSHSSVYRSVDMSFEKSVQEFSAVGGSGECSSSSDRKHSHNIQPQDIVISKGQESTVKLMDKGQPFMVSSPTMPNSFDRASRPKGPRMAKVIRRFNCIVEPLEYGVVLSGKLWCSNQAIYPKGFRSRVRYLSFMDPTQMCYYISEILDAGLHGPLFMVKLEQCPSEVFINVSPFKCWDMVRERVNLEIQRQHSLGKVNLPSLQPLDLLMALRCLG